MKPSPWELSLAAVSRLSYERQRTVRRGLPSDHMPPKRGRPPRKGRKQRN